MKDQRHNSIQLKTSWKAIQTGGAQREDDSLIKKYRLFMVNSNGVSFAEERTLEMFS